MAAVDPEKTRRFALQVVQKLREAGYQALWAGGCVRDELLKVQPEDYDVATSATPEETQEVFGKRRTLAVGAAFGVIVVLGPKGAGQIDVATFRSDAQYSDGRHPDRVTFSSPEEDAQRRDYTINGLFYDPIEEKVIDYVGGVADLQRRVIRAIGNPHKRISEDKLRMLRAIRFTAAFDFVLEPESFAAIQRHAKEINVVSAERISGEMRRMLTHRHRQKALQLMQQSGLLEVILPEIKTLWVEQEETACKSRWEQTLAVLDRLQEPSFPVSLAVLLRELHHCGLSAVVQNQQICKRWKLSNEEIRLTEWLLEHEAEIRRAGELPWPRLQCLLIHDDIEHLLKLAQAIACEVEGSTEQIDYCREKLELPQEELNPAPLLSGNDLIDLNIPRGRAYKTLLKQVRDAQLEKKISIKSEALRLAEKIWRAGQEEG